MPSTQRSASSTLEVESSRTERGREPFAKFLEHMARCYREELRNVVVMSTQDGRRVAAEFVVHGEYLQTDEGLPEAEGQRYVLPAGAFFELVDYRIARVTNYYNLSDWLQQVGAG